RRRTPGAVGPEVVVGTVGAEQLVALDGLVPDVALGGRRLRGREVLLGRAGGPTGRTGVADVAAGAPIEHAPEVARDADRPGERSGAQADALLDLVQQCERVE